jgi:outer membrane protein insertion porin family
VTVKVSKTGEFSFGGGYSSIDLLIGFVEITQRNFDIMNFPAFTGGGQSLSIKAEVGMVRNNFNIGWTDPWILGYPYSFGFDIYNMSHNKRGDVGWYYDETRTGGDLKLGKEFTDYFRGNLFYRLEDVRISDVIDNASQDFKDEAGSNWISSLAGELIYDTRDNVFNPTKGFMIDGSFEDAGGIFFGDKDFIKGTATAAIYHTFFKKFTLELRGRGGLTTAYGDSDEVPIYERFYAGGANTIRGYKERRVGPRDPGSDVPIGGEAILIGNAELTFPIYEKMIKGAIFYDVGNVWRRAEDFMVGGNYKSGVGVGARVKTPLGPIRVDYGYPLVGNYDDERNGEFYFSMSRGF